MKCLCIKLSEHNKRETAISSKTIKKQKIWKSDQDTCTIVPSDPGECTAFFPSFHCSKQKRHHKQ